MRIRRIGTNWSIGRIALKRGLIGLTLAILAVRARGSDDSDDLVRLLGSSVYSERENAARALDAMGRRAVPALARAKDAEDPEVRARAAALASTIQKRVLIEPTEVVLDFRDQSIAEISRKISDRSGMALLLVPDHAPVWTGSRLTLEADGPVPFWTALDRLCEAGGIQVQPSPSPTFGGFGGLVGSLRLSPIALAPVPTSDQGPFRTTLVGLQHHRDLTFVRGPGSNREAAASKPDEPTVQIVEVFQFTVQVAAEPRLLVIQSGLLQVTQATDEKGRSLAPADGQNPGLRTNVYFGGASATTGLQIPASLDPPAPGTTMLRVLAGKIPVSVASPRSSPLVVKLAEAAGKTFRSEDTELTVEAVNFDPNVQRRTIDLTVRANESDEPAEDLFAVGNVRSSFILQSRFDVVDAQGRSFRLLQSRSNEVDPRTTQITLALIPMGDMGEPVELRFFDLVSTRGEISFEFRDVPVP